MNKDIRTRTESNNVMVINQFKLNNQVIKIREIIQTINKISLDLIISHLRIITYQERKGQALTIHPQMTIQICSQPREQEGLKSNKKIENRSIKD